MVEPELHPSEEHELVAASAHRKVLDRHGHAVGQVPRILPGSLDETQALRQIDDARILERYQDNGERRRRQRRYWATRPRHEA